MKRPLFLITLILLFLFASPICATVIYDNFNIGDGYNVGTGYTISTSDSSIGSDWDQGISFAVTNPGYYLNTIELSVGLVEGPNELDVWLMNDSSGEPGSILESFYVSDEMGIFGNNNPPLLLTSLLNPLLTSGSQYWVIASATGPGAWLAWNLNSIGATGQRASRVNLGAWNVGNHDLAVLRVTGSAVPEPSTMLLLGAGLLGLAGATRRKLKK